MDPKEMFRCVDTVARWAVGRWASDLVVGTQQSSESVRGWVTLPSAWRVEWEHVMAGNGEVRLTFFYPGAIVQAMQELGPFSSIWEYGHWYASLVLWVGDEKSESLRLPCGTGSDLEQVLRTAMTFVFTRLESP